MHVRTRDKKNRFPGIIACVAALLLFWQGSTLSGAVDSSEIKTAMDRILLWQCEQYQVSDAQQLVDEIYAADPLSGNVQSLILGICGAGYEINYTRYIKALQRAMQEKVESQGAETPDEIADALGVTSLQKIMLTVDAIEAVGGAAAEETAAVRNAYIDVAKDHTIGRMGIMSYLYGLLMLDGGGYDSGTWEREEILLELSQMQLQDGGFALRGNTGDVDITAMAVQAMAAYEDNRQVADMLQRAVAFLRSAQREDGDYGTVADAQNGCVESTAQVVMAFCALGKDYYKENSPSGYASVWTGLQLYEAEEGGYVHALGGKVNEMGSSQAMCALAAMYRTARGAGFLLRFQAYEETDRHVLALPGHGAAGGVDYRWIVTGLIGIAAFAAWMICVRKRKAGLPRICGILLVAGIAVLVVWRFKIETKEQYLSGGKEQASPGEGLLVSLEICCDSIVDRKEIKSGVNMPEDGCILAETNFWVTEGTSVFELLDMAVREYDIQMEYAGDAVVRGFVYVQGIAYLYEGDFGDLSGWMYRVNGRFPQMGCGEYLLQEGDQVIWVYTTNLGKDVEDDRVD